MIDRVAMMLAAVRNLTPWAHRVKAADEADKAVQAVVARTDEVVLASRQVIREAYAPMEERMRQRARGT